MSNKKQETGSNAAEKMVEHVFERAENCWCGALCENCSNQRESRLRALLSDLNGIAHAHGRTCLEGAGELCRCVVCELRALVDRHKGEK